MKSLAELDYGELLARAAAVMDLPQLRHLPGQHNQQDHAGLGRAAAKVGQLALDASPAKLVDDGLGPMNPEHERGSIVWSSGAPGWSEAQHQQHLDALENYRGGDYRPINRSLRGMPVTASSQSDVDLGEEGFKRRVQDQIDLLDGVMKHSQLTDDVEVMRGTSTGKGVFGDALAHDLTGFEWTEDAYMSTSVNPAVAEEFTVSGLLLNIRVPKGTGVVALSGLETPDGEEDEAELLLERGLRLRVVADTGPGNPRRLEVEVVK